MRYFVPFGGGWPVVRAALCNTHSCFDACSCACGGSQPTDVPADGTAPPAVVPNLHSATASPERQHDHVR